MKTKLFLITSFLTLISFCGFSQNGKPTKVGEEIYKTFESNHPYLGSNTKNIELVSTQRIFEKDASYIAVHFERFDLKKGDYLIIRNPENTRYWKYSLDTQSRKKFWSIHIYGQEAIIEIYSKNKKGGYGYKINKIAKGYQFNPMAKNYTPEALCGPDDSKEAKCYQTSEPFIYEKSRSVARLLINGTSACTGWLIGDDGHLMTNEHCVENATTANNVTVEFMAEGSNCNTDCRNWFGCGGTIEATSTTLVRVNSNLDYALLKLPNNVSNQYGFLQLREEGATQGERIYIPQHPQAWGKRIALESTDTHDTGSFARVHSLNEPRCGGNGNDLGYYADTQSGSSGSPVLGHNDNLVIALHHCGSCPNRGVPIQEIINNLGNDLPNNAIGYSTTIGDITALCHSNSKTINLNNNQNNPVTWQVSSNVTILSSSNSSITLKAKYSYSSGNGWVKATLSNGIVLEEYFGVNGEHSNNRLSVSTSKYGNYLDISIKDGSGIAPYTIFIHGINRTITTSSRNYSTYYPYQGGSITVTNTGSCGGTDTASHTFYHGSYPYYAYPNPATTELTIQSANSKTETFTTKTEKQVGTYKLFNFKSKVVSSGSIGDLTTIDVSLLNRGVYFLKIYRGNKVVNTSHIILK